VRRSKCCGRTNQEIVAYLNVPRWRLPLLARDARALARHDRTAIRLFPGATAALAALKGAGIRLGIGSSNAEDTVRHVLARHANLVDHYGCGASLFGKAAKLRRLLRASGVDPANAILIGDETRDIDAARSAGVAAGAVTWGYATPDALIARKPDFVFETFDALTAAMRE
jgi:phosphoglycolate phosphatase